MHLAPQMTIKELVKRRLAGRGLVDLDDTWMGPETLVISFGIS
jgi:hypothetical protein